MQLMSTADLHSLSIEQLVELIVLYRICLNVRPDWPALRPSMCLELATASMWGRDSHLNHEVLDVGRLRVLSVKTFVRM